MAIGKTNCDKLSQNITNILNSVEKGKWDGNGLYSTWNTFQYVVKNLNLWADETIVGNNVKINLENLTKSLLDIIESTSKLTTKLLGFVAEQRLINSDSTEIDKIRARNMLDYYLNDQVQKP